MLRSPGSWPRGSADSLLRCHRLNEHAGLLADLRGAAQRDTVANQYLGKLGHTANGVVSGTSQWMDGHCSVPVGVRPYWPALPLR